MKYMNFRFEAAIAKVVCSFQSNSSALNKLQSRIYVGNRSVVMRAACLIAKETRLSRHGLT